jgi:hypothetical protein
VVGRFGWRRSRWKGRQSYILCEQEWRTGEATRHGGPTRSYAGVPTVFLQHTRVSRGGLAREQENPEVHGEVGIANQSGSIVSSHKSTTSSNSYSSPIVRARPQHLKKARKPFYRASSDPFAETSSPWQSRLSSPRITVRNIPPVILHPLQSPGKLLRHPRNLITVEHFSSPILFVMEIHFPLVLLHNQSYPKVCPEPLNLPNAGNPLCRNIIVIFLFSIFPDQGLNCFDLEGSRVFSVKLPELSLFQISELLHFIGIRKKFIKIQNQFCLSP